MTVDELNIKLQLLFKEYFEKKIDKKQLSDHIKYALTIFKDNAYGEGYNDGRADEFLNEREME